MKRRIKYTTVSIQEISAQPALRLDPGYWINRQASSRKRQATSLPQSDDMIDPLQKINRKELKKL